MSFEIVHDPDLTNDHIRDIGLLYDQCNTHDNTSYVYDLDEDFKEEGDTNTFLLYKENRLVSSLNIFAPTKVEAEITALTLPEERKQGYSNKLISLAKEEIKRRSIPSILYVCDSNAEEGITVLKSINAKYEYSEYLMEYSSEGANPFTKREDLRILQAEAGHTERLIEINEQAFPKEEGARELIEEFFSSSRRSLFTITYNQKVIGMIGVYFEATRNYIHGFCIDSNYRHKGIGTHVLYEIVQKYKNDQKSLVLEVQTQNSNALKVYQNVGFKTKAEFRYYREYLK